MAQPPDNKSTPIFFRTLPTAVNPQPTDALTHSKNPGNPHFFASSRGPGSGRET